MPSIELPFSLSGTLPETLSEFPGPVKNILKRGFGILARASEEQREKVLIAVQEIFGASREQTESKLDEVGKTIGFSPAEGRAVVITATIAASAAISYQGEDAAEQFVQAAIEAKVLEEDHRQAASKFMEALIGKRAILERSFDRASVARSTLPSFRNIFTSMDLRLAFEKGKVKFAVPVAVVHLSTDVSQQGVWFQLTRNQLDEVIEKLKETQSQMEEAERLIEKGTLPNR